MDSTGKKAGRGAYLCKQRSCWEQALTRNQVARALKLEKLRPGDQEALAVFGQTLPDAAPEQQAGVS